MSPLLALLQRAAEDLLEIPEVRSRLAHLLRDALDVLDAPPAPAPPEADSVADPETVSGLSHETPSPEGAGVAADPLPPADPPTAAPRALETVEEREAEPDGSGDGFDAQAGGFALGELLGHFVPPSTPPAVMLDTRWEEPPQVTLADLASRFDLKADVSRFLALPVRARVQREAFLAEGANRFTRLWMLRESGLSTEPPCWYQLGECYEACAGAARLLALAEEKKDSRALADALPMAAQATSALRQAFLAAAARAPVDEDVEQRILFQWLRYLTWRDEVHVARYMRLEDPFPPEQIDAPARWIEGRLQAYDHASARQEALKGVAYRLRQWRGNPAPLTATFYRDALIGAVEKAVAAGTPPSSRTLRELLLPYYEELPRPEEPSDAYAQVLDALDAAVERLAETPEEDAAAVSLPEAVATAASLLRGSVLLFIGGTPRPEARAALEAALDLEEVVWPETRPHESPERFRPLVADPRVRCVVQLIRFSSHAYGELIEDCKALGKPLVRLPGGYNPHLVAHHIVEQAGRRLGEAGRPA